MSGPNVDVFNFIICKAWEIVWGEIGKGNSTRDSTIFSNEKFLFNIVVFAVSSVLSYTVSVSIWMFIPFWGVFSLVSLLRKELCLGGMHCHLLFCEPNGGRDRAAERGWASTTVQWWPLWTEGIQTPRQDKVRGNWPAWSFPWEGGGTRPFILSRGPRSSELHLTNKILSRPDSWVSLELGDADT